MIKYNLHTTELEELTMEMATKMNLTKDAKRKLLLLSQYHDIGKVRIPKRILLKKAPLTVKEWEVIKSHPEIGFKIAKSIPKLKDIAELILYHHERWDGKGYPHGLKGEEIPLESRIIAILDAYNAMTTNRPYRKAITHKEAISELERHSGTQFDPELVKVFISIFKQLSNN